MLYEETLSVEILLPKEQNSCWGEESFPNLPSESALIRRQVSKLSVFMVSLNSPLLEHV